jgi:hypothetical protein
MTGTESVNIAYLSKAFKRLSGEKKDCVLNAARSLLQIQDGSIYHASANKPVFHNEKRGIVQER